MKVRLELGKECSAALKTLLFGTVQQKHHLTIIIYRLILYCSNLTTLNNNNLLSTIVSEFGY